MGKHKHHESHESGLHEVGELSAALVKGPEHQIIDPLRKGKK